MADTRERIIEVSDVSKTFRQHRRFSGKLGALRTLVTRKYTEVAAVHDVSFSIKQGEAVGYLGPNGAGKSTMIKMMTGILVPSAGRIEVLGHTPHLKRQEIAREIGVVFGQRSQLWWDLPLHESFELHKAIYRIEAARYAINLEYLIDLLGLSAFLERPVRQLSLGQRMRAEIGMALLHDPKVVVLDEPTIGLDIVAKDAVRKFLGKMNRERNVTIILTTHDLQDIETICPRLIMVDQGAKIFDGPLSNLRASFGSARRLTLVFGSDPGPFDLPSAQLVSDEGLRKHYVIRNEGVTLVDLLGEVGNGRNLKDAALDEPDIEEVIRSFYQQRDQRPAMVGL